MASVIFEIQQSRLTVIVNDVAQFTSLLLFKIAVISNDMNDFVTHTIKHI